MHKVAVRAFTTVLISFSAQIVVIVVDEADRPAKSALDMISSRSSRVCIPKQRLADSSSKEYCVSEEQ